LPGPNLAGQHEAYLAAALQAYKTGVRDHPVMSEMAAGLSDADLENLAAYYAGLSCGGAHTGEEPAAAAGRAMSSRCALCHGAEGVSGKPLWPSLAGQSADYLVNALQAYKEGGRKNPLMSRIVRDLSDADAASLAAYFSNATCR
jgi:cytochrome c553